mgnify:CR=1 FL=1
MTFFRQDAYTLIGGNMSKESFKAFVSKNPNLIRYVKSGEMTWQKFYELYDIYGENIDVWGKYLESGDTQNQRSSTLLGDTSLKDLFNTLKKVDLETVRRGVDGLQKAVSLIQDLSSNKPSAPQAPAYQRRPMYKYFED